MRGIPILGCLPNSPAGKAGLQYGDILLAVNGHPVSTVLEFIRLRSTSGRELELLVQRGTRVLEVTLKLRDVEGLTPQAMLSELAEMGTHRLAPGALHERAAAPECIN